MFSGRDLRAGIVSCFVPCMVGNARVRCTALQSTCPDLRDKLMQWVTIHGMLWSNREYLMSSMSVAEGQSDTVSMIFVVVLPKFEEPEANPPMYLHQ